jgi:hypothetical protein
MYIVFVGGEKHVIQAKGLTFQNGTLLFHEEEGAGVRHIVPAGKWDYLEVGSDCDALQVVKSEEVPVQPEAGSSEEVCSAHPQGQEAPQESCSEEKSE